MGKLDGKVAIVAGASRGIGKAIAQHFASEGAKVACAARTLNEGDFMLEGSVSRTVSEIEKAGGTALAVRADVSKEEDCANLVAKTRETFGPTDVLVNNAALVYGGPSGELSINIKRWVKSFQVNLHGPFMLSQMVLPDMIERRSGAIINISAWAAIGPGRGPYKGATGGGAAYGVTKAALERFTQGLAQEVYQYGITVASVSPCMTVPTEGSVYKKLMDNLDDPTGEPAEMMAKAALLLATEPLDKVTGRVTYSQAILKEFGWITEYKGSGPFYGIDIPGSGFSQI